jgi:hypothetical protein
MAKTSAAKPEHYVNNEDLLNAFIAWKLKVKDAEESGEPKPQVPNYIAECLLKIATRLSYKSNFINYGFREDMISDAIENCLTYIHNFDPDKSRNPFAYFTQIIYYAFLRKIQKEKKQLYIRYKALENSDIFGDLLVSESSQAPNEAHVGLSSLGMPKLYDNMKEFITTFEDSVESKKKTKKKPQKKRKSANTPLKFVGEDK